jgi:chromosomal replication initiation ATPase DnaA
MEEERLTGKRSGFRDERAIAMEMIYRYSGISQAEIGKMFGGLDYTAVSRERKRLRGRIEEVPALRKVVRGLERVLMS